MLDLTQLSWLGKKDEIEIANTRYPGKLAGKSWEYQRNFHGLIRTRAIIFIMALLVFYPVATNYFIHGFFSMGLLIERSIFSLMLIVAGLLFNKFRIVAIILALLPVGIIILTYLMIAGQFSMLAFAYLVAIFLAIGFGFYHHYKVTSLRKMLESAQLENQLIDEDS